VSGTAISSTTHNSTMSDIATELTNSLDRSGRGAMTAPLQLSSGSAALPGLTFSGDTDSGFYRVGANDVAITAGATKAQEWTSTGTTVPGTLGVTGATTLSSTLAVTGATTLSSTLAVTGATTLSAAFTQSGGNVSTSATLPATGTTLGGASHQFINSAMPTTTGRDYPLGCWRTSASNAIGICARARSIDTIVDWTDAEVGISYDVDASAGAGAALWLGQSTLKATKDIALTGSDPASSTAFTDTLTPKNIVKAWASINGTTVTDGFNVTSVADSGNNIVVTFASSFTSTNFAVFITPDNSGLYLVCIPSGKTASSVTVGCLNAGGGTVPFSAYDLGTSGVRLNVLVLGAQ